MTEVEKKPVRVWVDGWLVITKIPSIKIYFSFSFGRVLILKFSYFNVAMIWCIMDMQIS